MKFLALLIAIILASVLLITFSDNVRSVLGNFGGETQNLNLKESPGTSVNQAGGSSGTSTPSGFRGPSGPPGAGFIGPKNPPPNY